jgi:phosphate-selective porin
VDGSAKSDQLDLGGNVGFKSDGTTGNLHSSPSAGGRIGWFYPLKAHYDLELGISGQSGTWDNQNQYLWSAAVFDAALHVSPYFELKGEYINSWVESNDAGTFKPNGWWIQAAYKLAGLNLELPLINNLELVSRYDRVNDGLGTKTERATIGYVYYFSNTLQFMGDYEFLHSNDAAQEHNMFMFQLAYGF